MASTTRGSIKLSTANDIGEALVEKLGGVGYSPNEWKEKYNLCGIAPIDSAPALSVLSDSAGTGDERGSILIATADAIGAILNKKYNVLRGFKPKEWASACRKMKALEEGSVASSPIASFSDGADTVPLTSCVCNIDANLDGKSAVVCTKTGKNLLDTAIAETKENNSVSIACDGNGKYIATGTATGGSANITFTLKSPCTIKSGMYFHALNSGANASVSITLQKQDNTSIMYFSLSPANRIVDLSSYVGQTIYSIRFYIANGASFEMSFTPMLCFSNTSTTFEPYQTPTQYTASLGRTIYGGSADIITGEGTESYTRIKLDPSWAWVKSGSALNGFFAYISSHISTIKTNEQFMATGFVYASNATDYFENYGKCWCDNAINFNCDPTICGGTTVDAWKQYITDNDIYIVAKLVTPEDFTFEPVKIDSFPGVNNIWNDCGNTAVEYYKAPTPYTRKTATGGIANFSDQRTDLPLTKAIANIAPSIAGKSAVNLYQGSEQYQASTTYTAELGETVYGGSVDFVSGEVVKDCTKDSMSSSYLSGLSLETYIGYESQTAYFNYHPSIWVRNWNYQTAAARTSGGIKCACDEFPASMNNTTIFSAQYRIYFDVNGKNISSVQDFIDYVANLEQNGKQLEITYEIATPTESAIPGRVISPIEGVNNYWNDAGGDTEIQYFENET